MSKYDRHFARRHITWKITNVTRKSVDFRCTPYFSISLGDVTTKWYFTLWVQEQHLALSTIRYLGEFSVKISAAVMKMSPNPTYQYTIIENSGVSKTAEGGWGIPKLISLDVLFDEKNDLLDGTDLTLELKLELIENPKIVEWPLEANPILDNYEKLINSEKYSDFVFICSDGKSVHVHKAIIAIHCEAFANMIEDRWSESETNSAKIADVDSETMTELVRFLYCRRVNNMEEVQERLVVAANKYRLDDLKNLCVSSLMESLTDENVINVFGIADLLSEEHLKNNCIDYIKCHQIRLQKRIKKEDLPKKLLLALWEPIDLHPIRMWFKNKDYM